MLNQRFSLIHLNRYLIIPAFAASISLMSGCGTSATAPDASVSSPISVDLDLPNSLTGARLQSRAESIGTAAKGLSQKASIGVPCSFNTLENDDDPFSNGYKTTRFMVAAMATWTCIADLLIELAATLNVHDGSIIETDNDTLAENYKPSDPTHYSIADISSTQSIIHMYYAHDRANPPTQNSVPGFYISWNQSDEAHVEGRLIVSTNVLDPDNHKAEDPVKMRMDFSYDDNGQNADMFLQFDENNPWADGMRIQIVKDLNASVLGQVYTARGLIKMTAQLLPAQNINEVPDISFFTVADLLGNGAAIAIVSNLALPLPINIFRGNHLGRYLMNKSDVYFFDDSSDWDYINKTISSAFYKGDRTTMATGGSFVPFNPSLDMIVSALNLEAGYFSGELCAAVIDADCTELMNAIFIDGFADQEKNQGSDPVDWRSDALTNADYLSSVYPNGSDWDGAFELSFTPSH